MQESYKRIISLQFDVQNESCTKLEQKPVYEVRLNDAVLWPVVIIEKVMKLFLNRFLPAKVHSREFD